MTPDSRLRFRAAYSCSPCRYTVFPSAGDCVSISQNAFVCAHDVIVVSASDLDLVLTDMKMPEMDGLELLQQAKRLDPKLPVVMMTAFATVETAVEAMKRGDVAAIGINADALITFRRGKLGDAIGNDIDRAAVRIEERDGVAVIVEFAFGRRNKREGVRRHTAFDRRSCARCVNEGATVETDFSARRIVEFDPFDIC